MAGNEFFSPKRFRKEDAPLEARIRALEEAMVRAGDLARVTTDPVTGEVVSTGAQGVSTSGGFSGGGGGSGDVLTSHDLLGDYHNNTTAAAPVRGDVIVAQGATTTWQRLALGLSGRYLRSDGTDAVWAQIPHTDLTFSGLTTGHVLKATGATAASFGQLLHSQVGSIGANDHHNQAHTFFGSDHSDVTGTPATGDLIYRNASSQWTRLAIGGANTFLKGGGSVPAYAQPAFTDLSGTLSAAQHGTQASTAGTSADHTGTISANARLQAAKNGTNIGSPAPTFDFIEGVGITLTVLQPSTSTTIQIDSEAKTAFTGWYNSDLSTAPTSATVMSHVTGVSAQRMFASGTLVGVVVCLSGDVGTSGDNYTVEVQELTSETDLTYGSTGISATVTGADIGIQISATGSGSRAFTSVTRLAIFGTAAGTPNAVAASAYLLVIFD